METEPSEVAIGADAEVTTRAFKLCANEGNFKKKM